MLKGLRRPSASNIMLSAATVLAVALIPAATVISSAPASAGSCSSDGSDWTTFCTVSLGQSNNYVIAVQRIVTGWGCSPGGIDGIFGTNTEAAVKCMQRKAGFPPDGQDGVVGPKTWSAMNAQTAECKQDGNWFYLASLGSGTACPYRQWLPSGQWYVIGLHGTYVQIGFGGPN
jgi:peptidoglycan hydrolase-like protein with peptidoglycan-binding domain